MASKNYTGIRVSHDMALAERLAFYSKDAPSGCRLWHGTIRDGYGRLRFNKVKRNAHVWAWECAHGPVLAGLSVLHRCDVRACINPDHLFLGTNADNVADKVAKGRQARNSPPNKTSSRLEAQILAAKLTHPSSSAAARQFGVSRHAVRRIWGLP